MGHPLPARMWWIDRPSVKAASNPTDQDLARLRAEGFRAAFSFLDEKAQPPNYDKTRAAAVGWTIYSFPIAEGDAAPVGQLAKFVACVKALQGGTKILMHCQSGLGRTASMAVAYWIAKGLPADDAVNRVCLAASDRSFLTPQRESVLREFARLPEVAGGK